MRKRPIKRQRLSGFSRSFCLCKLRSGLASNPLGNGFLKLGMSWIGPGICAFNLLLFASSLDSVADEINALPPALEPFGGLEESNSNELMQAIIQLQEQVRSQEQRMAESAREAKELADRNAESFSGGLQRIERAFSEQQQSFLVQSTRELEAMQSANRNMLIVVAAFATTGFLAILTTACFQWRLSKAWARISMTLPAAFGLRSHATVGSPGAGDYSALSLRPVDDSNSRLLATIERIERRIQDLEQSSKPTLQFQDPAPLKGQDNQMGQASRSGSTIAGSSQAPISEAARISQLLSQGQSRWRENDLEAALGFFDEVLSLNPNQGEALVRKGATLERLKKLNEAFECYDRAIAANDSMTIAYLHKGGLCNRLERFKEALECYEKALRTQESWGG